MKPGVKVDVVRELMGVVERGCRHCVMRRVVERVCLDVLCRSASGRADLCMGGCHVLERKGVRCEQPGDCAATSFCSAAWLLPESDAVGPG